MLPGGGIMFQGGGRVMFSSGPMMPTVTFGGMPLMMVQGHFGFDPWEDLHQNVQRAVHRDLAQPRKLEEQLGGLLDVFGDHHSGQVGRAQGSFQVENNDGHFRVTALLPGYKFTERAGDDVADSPLSVRVVGHRSLVVSGLHQSGPVITSWQRSFALPKGSDIDHVSVTYSSATGNLTVDVPRGNSTVEESDEGVEAEDDFDPLLPPALSAMRNGLPDVINQLLGGQRVQAKRKQGFLTPATDLPSMLDEVLGMVGRLHPRYHPPPGGDQPVPEDADVNLVGCFAETQLAQAELKYYGDGNAASFAAMYWHAQSDHVPYFALARHEAPLGHAFTVRGFAHDDEKPQWGVYDGCGSRCEDDPDRWCGCSNEGTRGFVNGDCPLEGEKRFAVYKIGAAPSAVSSDGQQQAQAPPVPPKAGRPYWQLSDARNGSGAPSIEIVVPKGAIAKPVGREVLLYNATAPAASPAASPGASETKAATEADPATAATAASLEQRPAEEPTATPLGKVRLPVGVSPEDCEWDQSRAGDSGQVLKCKLAADDVKQLPIKVIDEL